MGLSLTVRNVNPLQNQNHLSKHRPLWRLSVSAVLWNEHFQAKPPQARRHSALCKVFSLLMALWLCVFLPS